MFSSNGSQVSGSSARFIEEVFSTYIYSGQNSNQQIVNNINTQYPAKALVWIKQRTSSGSGADKRHILGYNGFGTNLQLCSNSTVGVSGGQDSGGINAYNTNGFTAKYAWNANEAGATYASWTFKTNPKFFDIATFTQASGSTTTFSHDLGSAPGCMFIKTTGVNNFWLVYHRSLGNNQYLILNTTGVAQSYSGGFSVSSTSVTINNALLATTGDTFVAFCFAHDAGGFGLAGADNMISCGSYTGNGSTQQDITLGYEPQWLMIKRTDTVDSWIMVDNMRGFFQTADDALCANNSDAESATVSMSGAMQPIATGFHLYNANSAVNASGGTYIYVAIRRGPMQIPTVGTSVYKAIARTGTGATASTTGVGFPPDLALLTSRNGGSYGYVAPFFDKLRGETKFLVSSGTAIENTLAGTTFNMDGVTVPAGSEVNGSGNTYIDWYFRRAPSFFDIVCYTGNNVDTNYYDGSARAISHNLTVVPEIVIIKSRSNASTDWPVNIYSIPNIFFYYYQHLKLNGDSSNSDQSMFGYPNTNTSSTFAVGWNNSTNRNGYTYVAYLFASCPGVSKIGYYQGAGLGTAVTVDCGFAAGPRFVLVKGVSAAGSWYLWDSTRGITAGNDPYLFLNSLAAEVVNTDYINTTSTGFQITTTAPASGQSLNTYFAKYLFLAIA